MNGTDHLDQLLGYNGTGFEASGMGKVSRKGKVWATAVTFSTPLPESLEVPLIMILSVVIVGGYIGLYSIGGATWDYIQYPLGLYMLGHDVYYVEDTRMFPVYQEEGFNWNDATPCIEKLRSFLLTSSGALCAAGV